MSMHHYRGTAIVVLLALALGLGGAPARAHPIAQSSPSAPDMPYLVKDINQVAGEVWSGEPQEIVRHGEIIYFSGQTPETGLELWRSDGTTAGTYLIRDLAPGPADSSPVQLTLVGDLLYFFASNGSESGISDLFTSRLWRSDGTAAGTFPVSQLIWPPPSMVAVGSTLYYVSAELQTDPDHPVLWRSDGTPEGTVMVTDAAGRPLRPMSGRLVRAGARIFFRVALGDGSFALWRSDGRRAGTFPVLDRGVEDLYDTFGDQILVRLEGGRLGISDGTRAGTRRLSNRSLWSRPLTSATQIFFLAFSEQIGTQLWVSDGTPQGTALVTTMQPGPEALDTRLLAAPGDQLYLLTPHDGALWVADGTPEGTRVVATIPGVNSYSSITAAEFDDRLLLIIDNALWISDGTPAGTVLLGTFREGSPHYQWVIFLGSGDGRFLFGANDGSGERLWMTDGTPAGTLPVAGLEAANGAVPLFVGELAGRIEVITRGATWQLWAQEGADFQPIAQLRGTATSGADPDGITVVGTHAIFTANDGIHGRELWASDGTSAGTLLLRDIRPGAEGVGESIEVTPAGERAFFRIDSEGAGVPWVSDGTPAGTLPVPDMAPGAADLTLAGGIWSVIGAQLFFSATDSAHGRALWVSDGTPVGTSIVTPLPAHGDTNWAQVIGGRLYFGIAQANQLELWASDGTAEQSGPLATLVWDYSSDLRMYALGNQAVAFVQHTNGAELWRTDGTPAGTQQLASFTNLIDNGRPLATVGGRIIFLASDEAGQGLWASDGTAAGTQRLSDVTLQITHVTAPVVVGERIFFLATDERYGRELWASDGTPGGTRRLTNLAPNAFYDPRDDGVLYGETVLLPIGERIFFMPTTPDNQTDLWISDGTPQGTHLVKEIYPGLVRNLSWGWSQEYAIYPRLPSTAAGHPFFLVSRPGLSTQLWVSDGTARGTRQLTRFTRGEGAAFLLPNTAERSFFLYSHWPDIELWLSDGTVAGTRKVAPLREMVCGGGSAYPLGSPGGRLLFAETCYAGDGDSYFKYWMSDGTAAGTAVAPFNAFDYHDRYHYTTYGLGGPARMIGDTTLVWLSGTSDLSIWVSDGSPTGSRYLINGGVPAVLGDTLLFTHFTPSGGRELWAVPRAAIVPFPTTPLLDAFDRRDGSPGMGWLGAGGTYRLSAGQLQGSGPLYWPTRFGTSQEAHITLSRIDPGGRHGLLLKVESRNDIVAWRSGAIRVSYDAADTTIRVETYQPGMGWQPVAAWLQPMANGDRLGAMALPDGQVEVYRNGSVVGMADTSATNPGFFGLNDRGRIGLWLEGAEEAQLDDFGGGTRP